MIRKLILAALTNRLAAILLTLIIIGAGIWAWTVLKKEAYPDVGDTQVTIITTYPGRAAEEVEQQVTLPVERAMNGVPKVITRRSKTIFGLSVVQLTFDDDTDDYWARQRVLEKLQEAELPEGVSPELGPLTGPVGEILRYVIEAPPEFTAMELRTLQDWTVVPGLLQVQGVADIINFGGLVKQYHIVTSPEKLQQYGLTLKDIIQAVQSNNRNTGGNIIRRGEQGFAVRSIGAVTKPEDLLNIAVTTQNGVPVFIRNLATVEQFPLPPNGILGYTVRTDSSEENNNSGIQGVVAMRRGSNASEVVELLKQRIQEINAHALPPGVRIRITYDRSDLVNYTIKTVVKTLFEGFSIVIIILIFFIGSVRSALVVATVIPVSLLFAFLMMKITGINANLLSLGAIDFGIIVDGAVVMVENIMRRYRDASDSERKNGIIRITLEASQEVGREIFFSISIIIMAFLPIFSFQRVEGKLFSPMAYTLSFAIMGSMLLALTFIPVLMTILYRKYFTPGTKQYAHPHSIEWHNPIYAFMEKVYKFLVDKAVSRPLFTVLGAGAIVVIIVGMGITRIGTEFLPELDEGAFNIRCFFPVGISLKSAEEYIPQIRAVITHHPMVKTAITQLGRNDDGTDPYGPNRMEILVGLKDYSTWTHIISKQQLLMQIKLELENAIPGAVFSFSQPILDNVTESVTGSPADVAILISGDSLALMRNKADSILRIIRTIPGASESAIEQEGNQAQLVLHVNREACARFGVNISDIQNMIEAAIGSQPISTLYEGNKRFSIVVRYQPEYRSSVEAVRSLIVTSPTGARIPMSELAEIGLMDGPTNIQRSEGKRQISVRSNIRGRDQSGFVHEAMQKVEASGISLPDGYSIRWGGQYENLSRAGKRLAIVIPFTLIIITLVLFSLFRNARYVAITLAAIPFALAGGIAALLLRGYNFNVSAGVGFICLFGVSIIAGILFVSRAASLRNDHGYSVRQAAGKAAIIQLRPTLMAILLALLGLIPAARATGIGSDVQRPLATVIVGGLCSALILCLLALPAFYVLLEKKDDNYDPSSASNAAVQQKENNIDINDQAGNSPNQTEIPLPPATDIQGNTPPLSDSQESS
jgi:cobalt-zinc-cadmium resistance protein CzcA